MQPARRPWRSEQQTEQPLRPATGIWVIGQPLAVEAWQPHAIFALTGCTAGAAGLTPHRAAFSHPWRTTMGIYWAASCGPSTAAIRRHLNANFGSKTYVHIVSCTLSSGR